MLGMHRSGTSCLTGSLQNAGLELGDASEWNKYNTRGNRENQAFVDFHEHLLRANGATWDTPPRKLKYTAEDVDRARALAASFGDARWGFKDPRALLALPLWNQVIPEARYVGIFRHPLAVKASLQRRDARTSDRTCLELWYHYNRQLYRELRRRPFPLFSFDWDEERFHARLNEVLLDLNLAPLAEDQRFYTQSLHNFSERDEKSIPWKLRRLYRKLQEFAQA